MDGTSPRLRMMLVSPQNVLSASATEKNLYKKDKYFNILIDIIRYE